MCSSVRLPVLTHFVAFFDFLVVSVCAYPFIHLEFIFGPLVVSFSSVVCVLIHSLLLICACMHLRCMRKLACMAGFTVQVSVHVSLKVNLRLEGYPFFQNTVPEPGSNVQKNNVGITLGV